MKFKIFALLGITAMILSIISLPASQLANRSVSHMPANPEKILQLLIRQGKVSATDPVEVQNAAVLDYLRLKAGKGGPDRDANPLAQNKVNAVERAFGVGTNDLHGRKIGNEVDVDPSTPTWMELEETGKLLLMLVEFSDEDYTWTTDEGVERTEAGPLHNQIPIPDNSFDLWVPDFSVDHFQDMMFTPGGWTIPEGTPYYAGEKRGSMYDYFLQQSFGQYTVEGDTYGWFMVDKPEAYYGDDTIEGYSDSLRPGTPKTLLADAIVKINEADAIDWLAYDLYDLYDLDGDGDIYEPDCIIDHPLFIHAGIDQSGGGGAQGDDAIWAHSSSTWEVVTADTNPDATCYWTEGTILYNYTIMPEDGGVGVFAHEYAHDLGLPDEYDTIYSGGNSTGFWTLQGSGSWIGRPAQTQPSGMSAWAKYALGWLGGDNLAVVHIDDLTANPLSFTLDQAERWGGEDSINGIRISLPQKLSFTNDPYSGEWEWFGGKGDEIDTTLYRAVDLTGKTSAELSFWTWYDIEENWDYGFVQVSTDGGATWTSLPIDGTSSDIVADGYPAIFPNMPGFTGSTGGEWLYKTYDLADYLGMEILLQFRYMTDWATSLAGFFVDDIGVTADGAVVFFDDVEVEDLAWVVDGWTRDKGSGLFNHYYIMEYRNFAEMQTPYDDVNIVNFDTGLTGAYQFDPDGSTGNVNEPWYFSYSPGLLLFYRDMSYTDNWTGMHPGGGFMLVVDAHPQGIKAPPLAETGSLYWGCRIQTYDAAFDRIRAPSMTLGYWGKIRKYVGLPAVPNFDDHFSYWNKNTPTSSVITPEYGLLFNIRGVADDSSAAAIAIGMKGPNTVVEDEESIIEAMMADLLGLVQNFLPAIFSW